MVEDSQPLGRRSKLIKLIFSQKWRRVKQILNSKFGANQVKTGCCARGLTVLSIAVNYDPPVDIVETILRIEPLHSLQVDSYGMLPLHVACMNGASPETIKLLLDHDQGACAQAIDAMRRAPLHYAVQYICQPSEILQSVRDGSMSTSKMSSLSTSVDLTGMVRTKQCNSCSNASTLTMAEDKFQSQIRVIELLMNAAPEIVFFADRRNLTPIDILQDCRAEYKDGSKWERASIVCSILREISVDVYREQKKGHEARGFYDALNFSGSSIPDCYASTSLGSTVSGTSNLSRMEIDCTSYNQMNVSVHEFEEIDTRKNYEEWQMMGSRRKNNRMVPPKENEEGVEEMDILQGVL